MPAISKKGSMVESETQIDSSSSSSSLENDKEKENEVQMDPKPPMQPNALDKQQKCLLALGSIDRIVAQGYLLEVEESNLIHGCLMGEGYVRVAVEHLENDEYEMELLPVPTADAKTLKEAIAGYVSWPKNLVILRTATENRNAPKKKVNENALSKTGNENAPHKKKNVRALSKVEVVAKNFESLVQCSIKGKVDKAIFVKVDKEVFWTEHPDFEYIVEVTTFSDDLMNVINNEEIGASVITVYMSFLYNKAKELGVHGKIRFILAAGLEGFNISDNVQVFHEYLDSAQPGQIFFYPYNTGYHWVLVIVDPWLRHSVYFDPLNNEVDDIIKEIVTYAYKKLDMSFKFSKNKNTSRIEKAMCPRQSGVVECGYYVLRYMRDCIYSHDTQPTQLFSSNETYGKALIDEVRVECMNFIRDHI